MQLEEHFSRFKNPLYWISQKTCDISIGNNVSFTYIPQIIFEGLFL